MNITVLILLTGSLGVLILGSLAWRSTSSRPILLNTILFSVGLLVAAFDYLHGRSQMAFAIPVFCAMLFGGRGVAFLWRSRKEPELQIPALMLTCVALLSGCGAAIVYLG